MKCFTVQLDKYGITGCSKWRTSYFGSFLSVIPIICWNLEEILVNGPPISGNKKAIVQI